MVISLLINFWVWFSLLLQDFCSSEAHSVPGKVKVVTETDNLAPLADLLALLKLLHTFTRESESAERKLAEETHLAVCHDREFPSSVVANQECLGSPACKL